MAGARTRAYTGEAARRRCCTRPRRAPAGTGLHRRHGAVAAPQIPAPDSPKGAAPVFSRCLFRRRRFPRWDEPAGVPDAGRLAYDPGLLRLWQVCEHCHRWSLVPLGDRLENILWLERRVRDRGRLLAQTANVALIESGELLVVRVGRAALPEQAWWRYGRSLLRRQAALRSPQARISAYTYGVMGRLGERIGLLDHGPSIQWDDSPGTEMLRWWHFGWASWFGRARCPSCNSVLRALPFDLSPWLYPIVGERGELAVGVPCQRCDPWTPEKVYRIEGSEAEHLLRRVLAYLHFAGASDAGVRDAAAAIQNTGSPAAYVRALAGARSSLWKMGPTRTLALEIALNEAIERRALTAEALAFEETWRREEELAQIVDEELTA